MITRIIEFCAKNRFMVFLAVTFVAIGAVWSIRRVKLDAIPDLSDPQVIVFTEWMGRSPQLVEDQVTYPIVSALVSAPHVTDVRGFSMFGMSFIYVIFDEGTDIYWARSRVLEYLNTIRARLPEGANPVIGPDATGIGWAFQYTLVDKSGKHGIDELRTFQDFNLRYAIGSVPGVAEVATVGGYQKQYQVTVDPNKLRAYNVTLADVSQKIRDSNNDVGGRIVEMSGREYYVRGRGYIQDLAAVEDIVVKTAGPTGTPVLVKDVGTVQFGPDIRRGVLEWNGEGEAVGAIVVVRYGENVLDVIGRVKDKFHELGFELDEGGTTNSKPPPVAQPEGGESNIAKDIQIAVAYDRSALIGRSIDTLEHTLVEEMIVVALVIIIFLLHLRSSLLPILSLPVAVAISFIPMYLLDIPSTIMSLGGIAIAIGATVDAEIVMIEASHKKLEHAPPGADRHRLLAEAAREVTPAIFFSLMIIAIAFIPVFALTGQAGRLFKPLAYTKTFVMLTAAILSITFAPALRDILIRGKIRPEHKHPISRFIIAIYRPFVYVAMRRPKTTVLIGALAIVSAVPVAQSLGKEFMPPLNEGDLLYMPITAIPGISIEEAKRQLQAQDRILREFPEVDSVFGKVGRAESPTDPAPLTMVETTVRLKPKSQWRKVKDDRWYAFWSDERTITWEELTTEMNAKMQFPGWTNAWTMPIKTRVDMLTTGIRTPIGIKIFGAKLEEIEKIGTKMEQLLTAIDGTRSVLYERNLGGLYLDIIPDRQKLARYGLSVGDVQRTIEAAIGGTSITLTIEGRNRFTVNVRYPQDLRSDVESLKQVLVPVGGAMPAGGGAGGGGMGPGMQGSLWPPPAPERVLLAQNMPDMPGADKGGTMGQRPRLPENGPMTDVPMGSPMGGMAPGGIPGMAGPGMAPMPNGGAGGIVSDGNRTYVPLGLIAEIKIVGGPPMVRDEDGMLVGYVYVDIDQDKRDIGGYVNDAKAIVEKAKQDGSLVMPSGYSLKWTGQYELLEEMADRMKIVIPITLMLIIVLLFLQFKNVVEVLIILLSIPFALVGSVWLLWLLDFRLSTAVYVGVIALVGLAAQTGIIMIVYIDHAYERRKRAGKMRDLQDVIHAHMEGTVMRVRPKLMTVGTMLLGLIPLLWATGSGADVMKRLAAPMVGGLVTSAFLTLEIIPVISTYWRREQLLWEFLAPLDPKRLMKMRIARGVLAAGWLVQAALWISTIYVDLSASVFNAVLVTSAAAIVGGTTAYFVLRPAARRQVWPDQPSKPEPTQPREPNKDTP